MPDDLPTPDELGEKLKRGEISKEEAIEIMSERARREAFANLFGPMPGGDGKPAAAPGGLAWRPIASFAVLLIALMALLWLLLWVIS